MPLVKYFTFLIFIASTIIFYSDSSLARSLKDIDQSIKAGNISNDAEKSAGEINTLSIKSKKNYKSNQKTGTANFNDNLEKLSKKLEDISPVIIQTVPIKEGNTTKYVQMPFLNKEYLKKNKPFPIPTKSKRISSTIDEKAARIGDESGAETPSEIPCPLSYFGIPSDTQDENRKKCENKIQELFDLANILTTQNYSENMLKIIALRDSISSEFSKLTDLCAVTKLLYCDALAKVMIKYINSASYLAKTYKQLEQDYVNSSDPIIIKVNNIINSRKEYIKSNDKEVEKSILKEQAELKKAIDALEAAKNNIYNDNSESTKKRFVYNISNCYTSILGQEQLLYIHNTQIGKINDAHSYFDINIENGEIKFSGDLYDTYCKVPPISTFKYNSNGKIITEQVRQEKNPDIFLNIIRIFPEMSAYYEQGFIGDESEIQTKIDKSCDYLSNYKLNAGDENNAAEVISPDRLKWFKDNANGYPDIPGYENIYRNRPVIKRMYFTRLENAELTSEDIPGPFDLITLRAEIDENAIKSYSTNHCFKAKIASQTSNRKKKIEMKCDYIYGGYCGKFKPNESDDVEDVEKNLIEVDPRQANPEPLPDYPSDGEDPPATTPPAAQPIPAIAEADISQQSRISAPINVSDDKKNSSGRTISIAQCDTGEIGYELKVPAVLYKDGMDSSDNSTHKFFTKALVRSYVKQPVEDVKNNVCPNSQAFLISGGGEYIVAGTKAPNDEFIGSSKLLVKRVANWFMIQGHGSEEPTDNAIGEKGKNSVQPSDIYYRSSSGKCYSFYEGMDVLILDTCYNLCNHKFRGWRKVLPKGVILGYHGEVLFLRMDQVLDKLMEKLKSNPNMTQAEIGQAWADVNKDVYDQSSVKMKGCWSYGYILPHPNSISPEKNIFFSGTKIYDTFKQKLVSIPNTPVNF